MATWLSLPPFMRMCTCEGQGTEAWALLSFAVQLVGLLGLTSLVSLCGCCARPYPAHRHIDGKDLQEGLVQRGLGGRHLAAAGGIRTGDRLDTCNAEACNRFRMERCQVTQQAGQLNDRRGCFQVRVLSSRLHAHRQVGQSGHHAALRRVEARHQALLPVQPGGMGHQPADRCLENKVSIHALLYTATQLHTKQQMQTPGSSRPACKLETPSTSFPDSPQAIGQAEAGRGARLGHRKQQAAGGPQAAQQGRGLRERDTD